MKKNEQTTAGATLLGILSTPQEKQNLVQSGAQDTQTETKTREELEREVTPEMRLQLEKERSKHRGRPRKIEDSSRPSSAAGLSKDYTRATFIVKNEIPDKLKFICFKDTKTLKNLINEILESYIEQWERDNR